jgi:hypothetical protein
MGSLGPLRSALAAIAIVGLLAPACDPNSAPERQPRNIGSCVGPGFLAADIDGDGRDDRVAHRWDQDANRAIVEACTVSGGHDIVAGMGMAEALHVFDIENDGIDEIAPVTTSVSASFSEIVRLIDGRLRRVTLASGKPLVLRDGLQHTRGYASGCLAHPQGLSVPAIVQFAVQKRGHHFEVRRSVYALDGTHARKVIYDGGGGTPHGRDQVAAARSLIRACWGQ